MKFSLPLRPAALVAGLAGLLFTVACTYTKAEEEPAPTPCTFDAATVSYLNDIKPLIQSRCYECHSAANNLTLGGAHNWENLTQLQQYAANGSLVAVLDHKDPKYAAVYMPRPIGSAKLPACDIELIRAWVKNGAPNN